MSQSHLKYTNQYDFLEKEGYLIDSNDATLLEEGKKAYRRWYKREHRKNSKKFHPEILVLLPDNEALSFIKEKGKGI
jgi:hypothetical protein